MFYKEKLIGTNKDDLSKIISMNKEIEEMDEVHINYIRNGGITAFIYYLKDKMSKGDSVFLKGFTKEFSPFDDKCCIYTLNFVINNDEAFIHKYKFKYKEKNYDIDIEEEYDTLLANLIGRHYQLDKYGNLVKDCIDKDNATIIKEFVTKSFKDSIFKYQYRCSNDKIEDITVVYENSFISTYLKDNMSFKITINESNGNYLNLKTEFSFKFNNEHIVSFYTTDLDNNYKETYLDIIKDIIESIRTKVRRM